MTPETTKALRAKLDLLGIPYSSHDADAALQDMLDEVYTPPVESLVFESNPGTTEDLTAFVLRIEDSKCYGISWQTPSGACDRWECEARDPCRSLWEQRAQPDFVPLPEGVIAPPAPSTSNKEEYPAVPAEYEVNEGNDSTYIAALLRKKSVKTLDSRLVKATHRKPVAAGDAPDRVKGVVTEYAESIIKPGMSMLAKDLLEDLQATYPDEMFWFGPSAMQTVLSEIGLDPALRAGLTLRGGYIVRSTQKGGAVA